MTIEFDVDKLYAGAQEMIAKEDVAREQRSSGSALFREKLKLQVGKEYMFRIVPFIKDGYENAMSKTFYRYYQYSWRDVNGGKWRYVMSPRTVGEKCPIVEWQSNYRRNASKEEVEMLRKKLIYKEGHYINVYVINDPVNPENNGTVKILDCPRSVWKLIDSALRGDLDDDWSEMRGTTYEVGPRVLDLSDNGVNLLVKVVESESLPGMPDYSKSKFTLKKAALGWDNETRDEVLNSAFDLSKVDRIMSADDINEVFTKTFLPKLNGDNEPVAAKQSDVVIDDPDESEDAIPTFTKSPKADDKKSDINNIDDFINSLGVKKDEKDKK